MGTVIPCTFFFLIICTNTVITAETHHRRSPQGFQGVRGKRSAEHLNAKDKEEDFENNHQILVATTTEQNFRDNELRGPQLLRGLPPLSVVKRAPMGFMGMRGKKDFEYTDFDEKGQNGYEGDQDKNIFPYSSVRYSKRAPSGFMGMRGKKLFNEEFDFNKRAPSGFLGMRGKKENDDILSQLEHLHELSENGIDYDSEFYENLQNDRRLLNEFGHRNGLDAIPNYFLTQDNEKRAPSSGFFGMRGKKIFETEMDDNEIDKRVPSAGFFGMRGKKWFDDEFQSEKEKRAPMGFQGMRGKKDVSDVLMEDKRVPAGPGFFGMRGKKGPIGSGFFGSRGKKGPFEFRGKFVGVRGKKAPDGSLRRLAMELGNLELADLQPAAYVDSDFESSKRAPSGFLGMRGKKWAAPTDK